MKTITLGGGAHRFEIKTTTQKIVDGEETTIIGHYLKVHTASEQKPNDFSDFSEHCSPNEGDGVISTTMEIVVDIKTEILWDYQMNEEADGLMDNFGNIYANVEPSN